VCVCVCVCLCVCVLVCGYVGVFVCVCVALLISKRVQTFFLQFSLGIVNGWIRARTLGITIDCLPTSPPQLVES